MTITVAFPERSGGSAEAIATAVETCQTAAALVAPILDYTTEIAALGAITADLTALAAITGDIITVAGIDTDVSTVAGIAANVTAVAGSIANVNAVAGALTNINIVAGLTDEIAALPAQVAAVDADATTASNAATTATTKRDEAVAAAAIAGGLSFTYSSTTTAGDPGGGGLRGNSATVSLVNALYIDNADSAGTTQTTWLDRLDASDNGVKGILTISIPSTGASLTFEVTNCVDSTGYRTVTVQNGSGTWPANGTAVKLSFARSGDSADATEIARSADSYRFGLAYYDTQIASGVRDYPPLLPVRDYTGTLSSGTRNADGTISQDAASTWTSPNLSFAPFNVTGDDFYVYVVATEALAAGSIQIQIQTGGTVHKAYATTTEVAPGVYKQSWANTNSGTFTYVQILIKNNSGATITRYPLEVYSSDSDYLPQVIRFDDSTVVTENRRVIDWDTISPFVRWGEADRAMHAADEMNITDAFDSVGGSDAASGLSYAPKQNLTAGSALSPGDVVGLKNGAEWNQTLATMLGTTTQGLRVRGYSGGTMLSPFPILDCGLDITGYTWTSEGSGTFSTTFPCATNLLVTGKLNYDYGSVVETTLADAAEKPIGSQQILDAKNIITTGSPPITAADQTVAINQVKAAAGTSLVVFTPGASTAKVYIHTRDGVAPDVSTTYSYKVTNLNSAMDWVQGNTRQSYVSNVEFRMGGKGLGIVCGSNRSMFDGIIAIHGYKHTLHIEAGECRNFLAYNKAANNSTTPNTCNCYISPNADGLSWRWENGAIYDSISPLYSHSAAGSYDKGEVRYVWFIATPRDANGSLQIGDPASSAQVIETMEEWCYTQGYSKAGRSSTGPENISAVYRNNLLLGIGWFSTRKTTEQNLVKVVNISGSAGADRGMRMVDTGFDHVTRNNLVYATNEQTVTGDANVNDYRCTVINIRAGPTLVAVDISRNIFLVDTPLTTLANGTSIVTETAAGMTWTSDYNVFIFCNKGPISSAKFGAGTKTTIADYLAFFPGHDANSLFIDLRDDPRGAKAVFIDPANGDFRWAQTEVAQQIRDYCILNGVGPDWTISHAPYVPTIDEAHDIMISARG